MAPKPAIIRYYVDADVLGLAKHLVDMRGDVTYPGLGAGMTRDRRHREACAVTTPATDDDIWIPITAEKNWVVITKDSAIGRTTRLRNLVEEHRAKLVMIAARKGMRTWDHLVVIVSVWDQIEKLHQESGPCMYRATKGKLTSVIT